jgi:co-chaperonin GroES (HSP10)
MSALKAPPALKTKPTIRLHPLEDRVIIRTFDEPAFAHGRLHIPDSAKEKPT